MQYLPLLNEDPILELWWVNFIGTDINICYYNTVTKKLMDSKLLPFLTSRFILICHRHLRKYLWNRALETSFSVLQIFRFKNLKRTSAGRLWEEKKAFYASKCCFWFGIFCCTLLSLRSYCSAERVLLSQRKVAAFHRYLNLHLCPVT